MKYALGLMAFLFPVHHHAPPPPVVTTTTTAPAPRPAETTTTTTTQPPPVPNVAPTAGPAIAPAVSSAPASWQVAWIVRCPPAAGTWYTYTGNLAQAQEIYNQQEALVGQPASPGCFYGSVSDIQQVTG